MERALGPVTEIKTGITYAVFGEGCWLGREAFVNGKGKAGEGFICVSRMEEWL